MAWTESFDINIENEVVKNIEYMQDGTNTKIIQSVLKISKSNVDSKLPVQSSHVEIDVPQIEGLNLVNTKVKANLAMTGEVTLRGNVLPIGGLKEKSLAAHRSGINKIIIPKGNLKDLDDVADVVKESITFIPVEVVDQVIKEALVK